MSTTKLVASIMLLAASAIAACVGCGERPPVDMSLLNGEPCEPPCWQGLVPGVSTEQEVRNVIGMSEYVDPDSVYRDRSEDTSTIWWESTAWWTARAEPNAFIFSGDTLMVIRIQPDYELTLGNWVDKYGPPEKLWAQWRGGGSADVLVNIYYPAMGLALQLVLEPSNGYHELEPQTRVIRAWYCPCASLQGFADLGDIPFPPQEYMNTDLHDWSGYGRIKAY